jgi:hypothetical protein
MKILTGKRKKWFDLACFILLSGVIFLLSFDLNFKDGKRNNPGVFSSDKSQYYVYLPATFIYGWDVHRFPKNLDKKYQGFILDTETNKLKIKTTCGVAILAAPLFLLTHGIALVTGIPADGFSDFYEKMGLLTPVLYLVLGLYFLKRFLDNYFKRYISWISVLILLAGTNLYHYGLVEGWMSHVFSFFLVSLYLFLLKGFLDSGKTKFTKFLLIALVVSLATLIRPTNILLLLWLILLDAGSFREICDRLLFFLRPKYFVPFLIAGIIMFIPQFIYWHYLSGSWIYYSYPGESFLYWKSPMILHVLFSPLNGLFIYSPLVLFIVTGIFLMIRRKIPNGWFMAFFFLVNAYIIGSWHSWFFGGSFGCRPFVEYYPLFTLAFAYVLVEILKIRNLFLRTVPFLLMFLCTLFTQRMIYDNRWNTSSNWAWDDLRDYLEEKNILRFRKDSYTYNQDFGNISFDPSIGSTKMKVRTQTTACLVYPVYEYACGYLHNLGPFLDKRVEKISASCWVYPISYDGCKAYMVCSIEHKKAGILIYRSVPINDFVTKNSGWTKVSQEINVPLWVNDPEYRFRFFIWNAYRRHLLLDDIRITFE